MLEFIVTIVLMASLGTMLYLVVRALPRVEEGEELDASATVLERWIVSEMPEKIDAWLAAALRKFLRRSKITVLKLDNIITKRLEKMKHENGRNGKSPVGLKQIVENKNEKENNSGSQ